MELARANTSSQQVVKCQGSGTNNILSKGAPTSSADWQRKQGGQWCSACWKGSSRTKAEAKLRRKKIQVWKAKVISVLSGFSFLPSHMSQDQLHLQVSSLLRWSFRQMNIGLLSWALLYLYENWRAERWKQVTVWTGDRTKHRDRQGYISSGTSVTH